MSVKWYVKGRLLLSQYCGDITYEEVAANRERVLEMIEHDGQKPYVHLVIDATQRGDIDPRFFKLKQTNQMMIQHDMLAWTLVADADPHPVLKFVANISSQIFQARFRVFITRAEALEFLYMVDQTLPRP